MDTPSLNLSHAQSSHLDLCFSEGFLDFNFERTSLGSNSFLTFSSAEKREEDLD